MIYITDKNDYVITWKIDQDFPLSRYKVENFELKTIQISDIELDFVRVYFSNIPMTRNRLVRYSGEMAYFILDNLSLLVHNGFNTSFLNQIKGGIQL